MTKFKIIGVMPITRQLELKEIGTNATYYYVVSGTRLPDFLNDYKIGSVIELEVNHDKE